MLPGSLQLGGEEMRGRVGRGMAWAVWERYLSFCSCRWNIQKQPCKYLISTDVTCFIHRFGSCPVPRLRWWLMGHQENLTVFGSMPITSRGPWTSLDMSQSMKQFLCEPARICPSVLCPVLKTVNQGKIQPGGDKYLGHPGHVHSWRGGEGRGEGWHLLMNQSWKQPFRDTVTDWML